MGLLDRLHKVATGIGGAVQAPFGFVKDVVVAPFRDEEEFDGFWNVLWGRGINRGGQVFENLFGPDEGLGAAIGAAPEPLRKPVSVVGNAVLDAAEFAYREAIAEPLSATMIAGNVAADNSVERRLPILSAIEGMVTGEIGPGEARDAYRMAQNVSPGQAAALSLRDTDMTDPQAVANAAGSDFYKIVSGLYDGGLRLISDPTIVAGKGLGAARTAMVVRPITKADDIARAINSPRVNRFLAEIEGKNAAQIRDQFFPDDAHGANVATILAEAPDLDAKRSALKALMGDADELARVQEQSAALAGQIYRARDFQNSVARLADQGFELPEAARTRTAVLQAEVDELYPQQQRLQRMEATFGALTNVPRVSLGGQLRVAAKRSTLYQHNIFGAPLRVAFNMRPQRLVNLHDQSGDVQVARMLQKSDLDVELQQEYRSRYMAALNPGERQQVLIEAESAAVRSIAERAGMSVDEIEGLLSQAAEARGQAQKVLQSRVYDGKGRSVVRWEDNGIPQEMHLPVFVTQEANVLPMVDLDEVKKVATRIGQFRARHPNFDIPEELMTSFHKVWRPSVLLRVGWPIRVVGDEQLRIMAKIGALAQMENLGSAGKAYLTDTLKRVPKGQRGMRGHWVGDYEVESAFGVPGDEENIMRRLVSSRASFDKLVAKEEQGILKALREGTGEWRSIAPTESDYARAYSHAVNKQLGQDAMARKLLAGESVDDVVRWLDTTPEGMEYAARLPFRRSNTRAWVESAAEIVDDYVPHSELRQLALSGKATADDLARLVPDASMRPVVHGEVLAQTLGNSQVMRTLRTFIDKAFEGLGSKPSDVLSRNRFFDHMYRAEVDRRIGILDEQIRAKGGRISDAEIKQIESGARTYALRETKKLLYDLAEESELAHVLRHLAPFYNAWQEVITRWAGLAVENPAFIARARLIWNAPEKAGLIRDENGNIVHEDGTATDPITGKKVAAGEERLLVMPEWADDLPGMRRAGGMMFNKKSLNMALQGMPGAGPLVQVPVNEIAKDRPDLESALTWVLPFGATQETRDLLMPATAKRLAARSAGEDDRIYRNTALRLYFDMTVDYNLGKREDKPTWQEAKKRADEFFNLRFAASFFMPAAPQFTSPYQPYIDAYRKLREADPETADEKFLAQFGEEFFPLTQSLSKSMDGVPPTVEAYAARSKYRDLIEAHPDLGGLIVGAEGAGEFNRAIYQAQLEAPLRPGSGDKQRESRPFEEAQAAPGVKLGWMKYRKAMDLIDAARIERGLPNLQVKEASDLAVMKRLVVDKLAQDYPEWFAEFGVVDRNKWRNRLEGLKKIAADPRLAERPDIQGLNRYLKARDLILGVLAERKAKSLDAASNQDVALLWETIKSRLVEQNLAFSDMFYRYLEGDQLNV